MTLSSRRFLPVPAAGLALTVLLLSGCEKEAITSYTVPRPTVRLLAVIVPRDTVTWFFRMSGPVEAISENERDFDEFIASVRFPEEAVEKEKEADREPITWTVPESWKSEQSMERMRYATFRGRLGSEMIVTKLGPEAAAVLPNVNRWRGQLALSAVNDEQLKEISKTLTVGGVKTATRIDCTGVGGQVTQAPPPRVRPDRPQNPHGPMGGPPARQIDYKAPPEWQRATTVMEQIASFTVGEGNETVGITVTPMGGGAGGLLANVNRWRGQVGLPEMAATEIEANGKQITIDGRSALFVDFKGKDELTGKDKRIVGAICETGGRTWFFKMTGMIEAVEKQKPAFDQFLRSVRFGGE